MRPVEGEIEWNGVRIVRTAGRHGTGRIGELMAPVSGFVLVAEGEPVLYIAGDTIWCEEVAAALDSHRPDVVVVNAGAARFLEGDPIVMTADDVVAVARHAPEARVVVVHLEAVNHCPMTRADLHQRLHDEALADRVTVPEDGAAGTLAPLADPGKLTRDAAPAGMRAAVAAVGSSPSSPGCSRAMKFSISIGSSFERSTTRSRSDIVATSSTCSLMNHCMNCSLV